MYIKQILIGLLAWSVFAFGYEGSIQLLLAFSILVLFPLILSLTYQKRKERDWFLVMQPFFSIAGAGSLLFEPGLFSGFLACLWLLFTCWPACIGITRASVRGFRRMEENAIDASYVYMVVGGIWLVMSRSGVDGLPFSPVIVLLTAIHFHYSSLIVPSVTGLLGRYTYSEKRPIRGYGVLSSLVIIGPLLVGIGITVGGLFDIAFVAVYVLALCWLAVETIRVMIKSNVKLLAKVCIGVASGISVFAMMLSALYSSGVSFNRSFITIQDMVLFHGYTQAFGYSFLVLVGWLLIKPDPLFDFGEFRISHLRGKWKIGQTFLDQTKIIDENKPALGLIDQFDVFSRNDFEPSHVNKDIRDFYEKTNHYKMAAVTKWHGIYYYLSPIYHWLTGKIGQLHLQAAKKKAESQKMDAVIYQINESIDGRNPVRAWIRKDHVTKKEIFVAFYAYYFTEQKAYMDIALPLPFSVMTGILRPQHDSSNGLILTSFREPGSLGDEGVYLTIKRWTFRLPIEEYFHVKATGEPGNLVAVHELFFLGMRCLTIDYEITCKL